MKLPRARRGCIEPEAIAWSGVDGSFALVPMGAFKVGKIAQHCIPFLSNHLAEESWVKDRSGAIASGIRGFAGYPLAVAGNVVGVLAAFSQQAMIPEFLEVLQGLCTTATIPHNSDRRLLRRFLNGWRVVQRICCIRLI